MDNNSIMSLFGLGTALICIGAPILKLNTTITKLNVTLDTMQGTVRDTDQRLTNRINKHSEEIDDLKLETAKNTCAIENLNKKA